MHISAVPILSFLTLKVSAKAEALNTTCRPPQSSDWIITNFRANKTDANASAASYQNLHFFFSDDELTSGCSWNRTMPNGDSITFPCIQESYRFGFITQGINSPAIILNLQETACDKYASVSPHV